MTTFLVVVLKSDDLFTFYYSSSLFPPSPDRFSSIQFSRKNVTLLSECHPLDGVTRGDPPPSDATDYIHCAYNDVADD